jgi:hypothetical protein
MSLNAKPDVETRHAPFPLKILAESSLLRSRISRWPGVQFPFPPKQLPTFPVGWNVEYAVQPNVTTPGGYATGIAVDATGAIHLVYWDCALGSLLYSVKNGGSWSAPVIIDTVNLAGQKGGYFHLSMALDSSGNVHVCYGNYLNGDLKHSWKANNAWNVEVVQPGTGYNEIDETAVLVDPNGVIHVLYNVWVQAKSAYILKYVAKTGASWCNPTDVDPQSTYGGSPAIVIDSKGTIHAVYVTTSQLKSAVKAPNDVWKPSHVIDTFGNYMAIMWTSIAVDPSDAIHLSYFDVENKCIKYATKNANTAWIPSTILFANLDFGMSSIAANAAGNVGLAFYNSADRTLEFMWKTKGSWDAAQVVDSTVDSGAYCHLAMDSKGSPHISYFRTVGANELSFGVTSVLHAYQSAIRHS